MVLNVDYYKEQLKQLLPQGMAWPKDDESTLSQLLHGFAEELARVDGRAWQLIEEIDPRTTTELLEDWERVAGLPESCVGELSETIQARRDAVVEKITSIGNQSPQYFIDIAAKLGFEITITEFRPFRAGHSHAGDPVYDEEWAYWWQVNSALNTIFYFEAGQNSAGDPLRWWGNAILECIIRKRKPAHTGVIFAYS